MSVKHILKQTKTITLSLPNVSLQRATTLADMITVAYRLKIEAEKAYSHVGNLCSAHLTEITYLCRINISVATIKRRLWRFLKDLLEDIAARACFDEHTLADIIGIPITENGRFEWYDEVIFTAKNMIA